MRGLVTEYDMQCHIEHAVVDFPIELLASDSRGKVNASLMI